MGGGLLVVIELGWTPSGAHLELAADALWVAGATAVEQRRCGSGTELAAGFPTADAARAVEAQLSDSYRTRLEEVDPTASDRWREHAQSLDVGPRLTVVPAWRSVMVSSGRLSLLIDPGPCFGSGTHASTRMILDWIDRHPPVGSRVVDVGTGSGILAVASALTGADSVIAVDVDHDAVVAARRNAERNGVGDRIVVSATPVEDLEPEQAEVVLVNVTAAVHAAIGSLCARLVAPEGTLVLAGLLPGQWQHVQRSYRRLSLVRPLYLDGWEGAILGLAGRP